MLVLSALDIQCVNIQFGIREGRFAALVGFSLPVVGRMLTICSLAIFCLQGLLDDLKNTNKKTDTDKILPVTECEA